MSKPPRYRLMVRYGPGDFDSSESWWLDRQAVTWPRVVSAFQAASAAHSGLTYYVVED